MARLLRAALGRIPAVAIAVAACGGNVTVDTGGGAAGANGGDGTAGGGDATMTATTTQTSTATGATTAKTNDEICAERCGRLWDYNCIASTGRASCIEDCIRSFQDAGRCAAELAAWYQCAQPWLAPPCVNDGDVQHCSGESYALMDCKANGGG